MILDAHNVAKVALIYPVVIFVTFGAVPVSVFYDQ